MAQRFPPSPPTAAAITGTPAAAAYKSTRAHGYCRAGWTRASTRGAPPPHRCGSRGKWKRPGAAPLGRRLQVCLEAARFLLLRVPLAHHDKMGLRPGSQPGGGIDQQVLPLAERDLADGAHSLASGGSPNSRCRKPNGGPGRNSSRTPRRCKARASAAARGPGRRKNTRVASETASSRVWLMATAWGRAGGCRGDGRRWARQRGRPPAPRAGPSPGYWRGRASHAICGSNRQTGRGVVAAAGGCPPDRGRSRAARRFPWPAALGQRSLGRGGDDGRKPARATPSNVASIDRSPPWSVAYSHNAASGSFHAAIQPDGAIAFVNPAFCEFHGRPAEEMLGTDFFRALAPAEAAALREKLARPPADGPAWTFDRRAMAAADHAEWQQYNLRRFASDGGKALDTRPSSRTSRRASGQNSPCRKPRPRWKT